MGHVRRACLQSALHSDRRHALTAARGKDFEPDLALEGGADGLDIFRRLLNAAPYMLRAGGLFACELYEGALDAAAELCRQAGLSDVRIVHDLTDRPRIVRAIVTEPKQRI